MAQQATLFEAASEGRRTQTADFAEKDTREDDMDGAIEEFIEDLAAETEKAAASDTFKEYLDAQSAFHDYSWRNTMLIRMQRPNATCVAGYRTWQDEFDRQVQGGEDAIYIFYPQTAEHTCPKCGNTPNYHDSIGCEYDDLDPDEWSSGIVTWRTGSVFDVSQTEGEPLPELPTEATGDANGLVSDMLDAGEMLSATVEVVARDEWEHDGKRGIYDRNKDAIEVRDREEDADLARTLAHEYSHALLHDGNDRQERSKREVEAEATAYVVGRHLGLDVSGSGFYLAAWSGEDTDVIRERLGRISKTAKQIIEAIE